MLADVAFGIRPSDDCLRSAAWACGPADAPRARGGAGVDGNLSGYGPLREPR